MGRCYLHLRWYFYFDKSSNLGWSSSRWLHADSGRVQQRALHPGRLNDINRVEPEWDEVHHKVRFKCKPTVFFPHRCPGTETRIGRAMEIVQRSILEVGGTSNAPTPIWLGCIPRPSQKLLVTNRSTIYMEEREESQPSVGQKSRCCFCPTEILFPLSSWFGQSKDIIK